MGRRDRATRAPRDLRRIDRYGRRHRVPRGRRQDRAAMTKPLRFDDEAAEELEAAASWYETPPGTRPRLRRSRARGGPTSRGSAHDVADHPARAWSSEMSYPPVSVFDCLRRARRRDSD